MGVKSSTGEQDVLVVAGEAFYDPKRGRIVLVLVFKGTQFDGSQSFAVPRMKELVAD